MSRCERCGYDSPHHVTICPVCGSVTTSSGDYTPARDPEAPGGTSEPFSYYSPSSWPTSSPGLYADPWPQQPSSFQNAYPQPPQVNVMVCAAAKGDGTSHCRAFVVLALEYLRRWLVDGWRDTPWGAAPGRQHCGCLAHPAGLLVFLADMLRPQTRTHCGTGRQHRTAQ